MNEDIIRVKREFKQKKGKEVRPSFNLDKFPKGIFSFFNQFFVSVILMLLTLIILKSNTNFKTYFYKEVYEKNFSFASMNSMYQKYFGSSIPFKDFFKTNEPVFSEKLKYSEANKYKDGVKLTVEDNYLIPNQTSGLVVFIGDKEGYGKTIVIQQMDGIDLWYANVDTVNIKLYDYVEKGKLLGNVKGNFLYLVYKKDGSILDFQDFI